MANREDRRARAREPDEICRSTGFLVLHKHGVPDPVTINIWQAAQNFFARSPAQIYTLAAPFPGCPHGNLGPNPGARAKAKGEFTPPPT